MARLYLMKKTLLPLLMSLVMASCGGSGKEISYDALPEKARQFIGLYFQDMECVRIVQKKDNGATGFEAYLTDGAKLEFDGSGEWTSLDCKFSALPNGILPENIITYIDNRYPDSVVRKAEKLPSGYEINITRGGSFYNVQCTFVGAGHQITEH